MELHGTDLAQTVIDGMNAEKKMSNKKRAALACKFAELGRYDDAAKALLRNYAASL